MDTTREQREEIFKAMLRGYLKVWFAGISKEDVAGVRQTMSATFDRPVAERLSRLAADMIADIVPTEEQMDEMSQACE